MTAEKTGFKKFVHAGIALEAADHVSLDISVELGNISQSVAVTGEAPLLETEKAGRREQAEELAGTSIPLNQARIFVCLRDTDRAVEALDRATAMGPIRIGWETAFPEYASLRQDPRLKALRKKVGFPE